MSRKYKAIWAADIERAFRVAKSIPEEVLRIIECDFRDSNGHRLTMCQDFIDLVELSRAGDGRAKDSGIRLQKAEYKTADGDVLNLFFEVPGTEFPPHKTKECFRIVPLHQIEMMRKLQELGLAMPIGMLCKAHNSQDAQCACCRLWERVPEKEQQAECGNGQKDRDHADVADNPTG